MTVGHPSSCAAPDIIIHLHWEAVVFPSRIYVLRETTEKERYIRIKSCSCSYTISELVTRNFLCVFHLRLFYVRYKLEWQRKNINREMVSVLLMKKIRYLRNQKEGKVSMKLSLTTNKFSASFTTLQIKTTKMFF